MFLVKSSKMNNYGFKKASPQAYRHDRSFYERFSLAWTNLQENEVEMRVRLLTAGSKPGKPSKLRLSEISL
jgi:hypothetical protein